MLVSIIVKIFKHQVVEDWLYKQVQYVDTVCPQKKCHMARKKCKVETMNDYFYFPLCFLVVTFFFDQSNFLQGVGKR